VGLLAIALLGVVNRFGHQIQVTFIGSTGGVNDVTRAAASAGSGSKAKSPALGADNLWHQTTAAGKAQHAPDVGGSPGAWSDD